MKTTFFYIKKGNHKRTCLYDSIYFPSRIDNSIETRQLVVEQDWELVKGRLARNSEELSNSEKF